MDTVGRAVRICQGHEVGPAIRWPRAAAEAESEAVRVQEGAAARESVPVKPARAETEAVESEVRAASFRAEQPAGLLPPRLGDAPSRRWRGRRWAMLT